MLRASLFTFAALYAVRRFAATFRGVNVVIIIVCVPVVIYLLGIHIGKQIGD